MSLLIPRRKLLAGAAALALMPRHAEAVPFWAFPRAYVDMDFANQRYFGGRVAAGSNQVGSLVIEETSIGTVYLPNISGLWIQQAVTGPKITQGYGLWAYTVPVMPLLQNRTLATSPWSASNVTVSRNQVGADGLANGACSLTATANNGTVTQAVTASSAAFVLWAVIRRLSGSGALSMSLDGGSTYTAVTSQIGNAFGLPVFIPTQTLANPSVVFKIGTSGDSFAIDFVQLQQSDTVCPAAIVTTTSGLASSYFETPTINTATYLSGGLTNDGYRVVRNVYTRGAPWSGIIEFSGNGNTSFGNGCVVSDTSLLIGGGCNSFSPNGIIQSNGHRITTTETGNFGLGNKNRFAWSFDGDGCHFCMNGGPVYALSSAVILGPSDGMTHTALGSNSGGQFQLNGPMSRYAVRQVPWTPGQLQFYSTIPTLW